MATEIPLQLQHHSFPNISIVANPDYKASPGPAPVPAIDAKLTVGEIDGNHNHYVIELRVQLDATDNSTIPYSLDVVCAMQAVVTGPLSDKTPVTRVMAETGHRLLFPAIRELVLNLTARQPWGQWSIGLGALGEMENTAHKGSRVPLKPATAKPPRPAVRKSSVKPSTPPRVTVRKKVPS